MAAAMQGKNDRHCCVPQCTGNGRLNPELSFHKIPINDELRKSWIHAIRRDPGPLFNVRFNGEITLFTTLYNQGHTYLHQLICDLMSILPRIYPDMHIKIRVTSL